MYPDDAQKFCLQVKFIPIKGLGQLFRVEASNPHHLQVAFTQCATGYPVPVPVPANPANIFQSGSGFGSGQILAGLAGFLKIIQKFSKMLKM